MNNIQSLLDWGKKELGESECPDCPATDARVLLCHALQCNQTYLMTWPDKTPAPEQIEQYQLSVASRKTGTPVAYITGYRDFWTLSLKVNQHTLIPRPETELLVEQALQLNLPDKAKVLDLGTGTGAIALALASEKPGWLISAVDFKPEAVELAKFNAASAGIKNVSFFQSDWFSQVPIQQFDLIVSNPPYVEQNSPWLELGDVRFEPKSALTSGMDGLSDIRHISDVCRSYLLNNGYLLLEHGFQQADAINNILETKGFSTIHCIKDLADLDRVTVAQYAGDKL
ncbi:peptide chain release factor N(5)-glutamine methyltransferase [Neptunicella marina]|uniref:Release factor glutamine methyltransferase n=1 Tax=Neptunicella marina TaxID=2125989 RepID=A0A8J6LZV7_9ALTE|nr:peptide chain release factor N(5)-glutamine methyltransferase [Neptunicella marina]MBC3764362.1 peptide chain release factor N(5)-glutamine methyltransferase [Neptunicella marina]